jgi:ketosteroid isomerase-like protein
VRPFEDKVSSVEKVMPNTITGREKDLDPTDAVGALAEFYFAFNSRSFELMELNWIDSEDASMLSPFGGVQRGWTAISQIYERLLRGKGLVELELRDYTIHQLGETFLAVGQERARYTRDGAVLQITIRTSRLFRKVYGRWRQYHHHGSIGEPGCLARFQSTVNADSVHGVAAEPV